MRAAVADEERLLTALTDVIGVPRLHVEFARWTLIEALLPSMTLDLIHQWGDAALGLWLVDRAIERSLPLRLVRRGGWRVA